MSKELERSAGCTMHLTSDHTFYGNHIVETRDSHVAVASVPDNKKNLLSGDYISLDYHGFLRGTGLMGTFCTTAAMTGSGLKAIAATIAATPVIARKPLWDMVQFYRQENARERIMAGNHWYFPNRDIHIDLPLTEEDTVEFTAGDLKQAPVRSLLASTQGMPGIELQTDEDTSSVKGTVNPRNAVRFMIDAPREEGQPNEFLLDAGSSLAMLDGAVRSLPARPHTAVASELQSLHNLHYGQVLNGLLGATATLLMTERSTLSERISAYAAEGALHFRAANDVLGPASLAARLLDPSEPMTWQQIQDYRSSLPTHP